MLKLYFFYNRILTSSNLSKRSLNAYVTVSLSIYPQSPHFPRWRVKLNESINRMAVLVNVKSCININNVSNGLPRCCQGQAPPPALRRAGSRSLSNISKLVGPGEAFRSWGCFTIGTNCICSAR